MAFEMHEKLEFCTVSVYEYRGRIYTSKIARRYMGDPNRVDVYVDKEALRLGIKPNRKGRYKLMNGNVIEAGDNLYDTFDVGKLRFVKKDKDGMFIFEPGES